MNKCNVKSLQFLAIIISISVLFGCGNYVNTGANSNLTDNNIESYESDVVENAAPVEQVFDIVDENVPTVEDSSDLEKSEENIDDLGDVESDADYYVFGSYEQDGDLSNGPEPIEWIVLSKDDNGILLLSRYVLDCFPYNNTFGNTDWNLCSLRKWLNGDFYSNSFSPEEKEFILISEKNTNNNEFFGTAGGINTQDYVFCLSLDEVMEYYELDWYDSETFRGGCQALITEGTPYAVSQGVLNETINNYFSDSRYDYLNEMEGRQGCYWWLRTPGEDGNYTCDVSLYGEVGATQYYINQDTYRGVRPALYILND